MCSRTFAAKRTPTSSWRDRLARLDRIGGVVPGAGQLLSDIVDFHPGDAGELNRELKEALDAIADIEEFDVEAADKAFDEALKEGEAGA